MTEFLKKNAVFLAAFLTICIIMAGAAFSVKKFTASDVTISDVLNTGIASTDLSVILSEESDNPSVMGERRLSQQVTVTTKDGTVPVSGKVVKSRDGFYPGTYELTFSNNAILNTTATVEVMVDAMPGDEVHILVGDKDSGYREFATVEVEQPGVVAFDTGILQNYTISTTDIQGAQEAMADILSSVSEN